MEVLLANPRGFCAGVERAVGTVEALLATMGAPVHVRHEIVHNRAVVSGLAARGAVFVDRTEDIPEGAVTVLSAHGVAPGVVADAKARGLRLVDATCPLVTKVHLEVVRHARAGRSVLVIGHRGHVEVEGLVGHFPAGAPGIVTVIETLEEAATVAVPDPDAVAWVTQTTLAVGEARRIVEQLRGRFPKLADPHGETICYATQNRQDAVRALAATSDLVLVVGAPHSSNSNRLAEVARESGARALLIEGPDELALAQFAGVKRVGLTASASAPERLVEATIGWLAERFPGLTVTPMGTPENVHFNLPAAIRDLKRETTIMDDVKPAPPTPPTLSTGTTRADRGVGASIDSVLDAAADLAKNLRETAEDAGEFASDQVARVVKAAADIRDRTINEKMLAEARNRPFLQGFRKSAHSALDVGFDAAAVAVQAGLDGLDLVLRRTDKDGVAKASG
jgi:4-hydroxy-3-methylbut-2-enyl diphosphate reductase